MGKADAYPSSNNHDLLVLNSKELIADLKCYIPKDVGNIMKVGGGGVRVLGGAPQICGLRATRRNIFGAKHVTDMRE